MVRLSMVVLLFILSHTYCSAENESADGGSINEANLLESTSIQEDDASKLSDWDTPPTMAHLPEMAFVLKNEGDVLLRIQATEEGIVDTLWVVHSSTHPELDSLAVDLFSRAVFNPPTKNGRPVSAQFLMPFKFRLRSN